MAHIYSTLIMHITKGDYYSLYVLLFLFLFLFPILNLQFHFRNFGSKQRVLKRFLSSFDDAHGIKMRAVEVYARRRQKTKRAAEYSAALRHAVFRSYDNPHTICQNLPESTVTSAGAEEG